MFECQELMNSVRECKEEILNLKGESDEFERLRKASIEILDKYIEVLSEMEPGTNVRLV